VRVLAVVNFKGGTGKTTAAAWMTHALAESSLDVFLVDADPQGSATEWAALAEWPFPVAGLAVSNLHSRLAGVTGNRDVVVIDTPPLEDHRAVVTAALRAASHVVVPVAPTPIEYAQLRRVRAVLDDLGPLRDAPPITAVLLTRVRAGTVSWDAHHNQIVTDGWHVLSSHVRLRERYAQSFGSAIAGAAESGYGDAAAELLTLEAPA
jgi:chromosome partitioning protein